ncbi:hypothetical protein EGH21_18410 [Halomicroarcula sp. F13]|uniref:Uncharacterized protein n=1 Tax=Haloarcula rubra TaxID=2487747 RepID=A0AAW4PWV6_9EURY|nr:hypothetical protein [Halomicroarcula rubra]MBX0325005.1 hypothetical protein [Halomicroarcula rubra]
MSDKEQLELDRTDHRLADALRADIGVVFLHTVSVAGDPAVLADEHLVVASAFRVTDVALNHGYSNVNSQAASTLCSAPDRWLIFITVTDQVYSCLETK